MAKISKALVDKDLREKVFAMIASGETEAFTKINDRQQGIILEGLDGENHYVRIGAIVAELREDMTAEELMRSEIDKYQTKQDEKAIKAQKKAEKIAADKAKREAEKEKKE